MNAESGERERLAGAFIGGVAVLGASRRMIAYYDKTNREEHAALTRAIAAVVERVTAVEVRLGECMAAVEGKLDLLIAQQQKPYSPARRGAGTSAAAQVSGQLDVENIKVEPAW